MTAVTAPSARTAALLRAMPWVFVAIWSTGFVVARLGMPHAPPFGFLAWRFGLSVLLFLAWIALSGARWPTSRMQWLHLAITGAMLHAGYLGGVWTAVKAGMGAGMAALLVGLQPLLTALWVSWSGQEQRLRPRQWVGLGLGLAGVVMVVWHKLGHGEVTPVNAAMVLAALLSITAGTLYQKRFVGPCDVRTANTVQLATSFVLCLPLALWVESEPMRWQGELWLAMGWSVLGLTLGGSSLLYLLIQRGAATRVSSLMYLVPPCTAVLAWALFGESLGPGVAVGFVAAALGVGLVVGAMGKAPDESKRPDPG